MRSIWSILRSILRSIWSILSKTGTKHGQFSVKQVLNMVKTQSNGRVNQYIEYKPVRDPEYPVCSYTPRFSYSVLKPAVSTVGHCSNGHVQAGCTGGVWYWGRVYGRAIPGYYPAARGAVPGTAKRARKACRAWSGGTWGCGRTWETVGGDGPVPTLRARSVPRTPPWYRTLQIAHLRPITARFDLISHKVS